MTKFEVGQKVYCRYSGMQSVVKRVKNGRYFIQDEIGINGWIDEKHLGKFIEPKYKVGDMVFCWGSQNRKDKAEIVKCALNKKRNEYTYLAFKTDSGFPLTYMESEVVLYEKEKVCKKYCKCGK